MPWNPQERDQVVKALAIVCELTATNYSDAAQQVILKQLGAYPVRQVLDSLSRCAAECKFKLTLADVIQRLEDGRPGAEEAWALMPKSEEDAGCVTEEMSVAWGAASALFVDDRIAARMAFKETYERETRTARAHGIAPAWRLSPGFDKTSTEGAAIDGMRKGLLSQAAALQYIAPENHAKALFSAGLGPAPKLLPAHEKPDLTRVKALVAGVLQAMETPPQATLPTSDKPIRNPPHFQEEG